MSRLELGPRLTRAGLAVTYLGVSIPLAVLAVLALLTLVTGAALSAIGGLGLPLLLGAAGACRALARADRRLANRLLHTRIPPLAAPAPVSGTPWRRSLDLLGDRTLWRTAAQLGMKAPLCAGSVIVGIIPVFALASTIDLAVRAIAGIGDTDYFGPWAFTPLLGVVLALVTIPVTVLVIATLDAVQMLMSTVTRAVYAPRAASGSGPVQELLAESLGDRSVSIAYWLPDRGVFVDEVGRPVQLPEQGSDRAWTAVEQDGRRVAAIIHDAALDTSTELVQAAASASSLAIDNERLKADLRARLEELRVSRLRIVAATDEARRRIERDLHDGAQQQLVALALELRLLKGKLGEGADAQVDRLSERLATALAELRELARGIHPAILTDRGLGPAIAALAERGPVPVDVDIDVPGRLPGPVEAAAYFLVAEGLTNVTKYAQATEASVAVRTEDGLLVVEVSDDGVGGADPDAGSGLRGLQDRLATVEGTLKIDSPPGGGTRLHATIPCSGGEPQAG